MNKLISAIALLCLSITASAYEIHGSSDTRFILQCNDGTRYDMGSYPPNHIKASSDCADHGGIAAGYPMKVTGLVSEGARLAPSININDSNSPKSRRVDKASQVLVR